MTKEETIINNVWKIFSSTEVDDRFDTENDDIYDSLAEDDACFIGGKSYFSKFIETVTRPLILMMYILRPHSERRVRIIIMCEGDIKLNIMFAERKKLPIVKIFKDEDDWQKDIEMIAWFLTELESKGDPGEDDDTVDDLIF